jgi:hypothetical protein
MKYPIDLLVWFYRQRAGAENRILKAQIKGRLLLSQEEKATFAEIAHRLGR